MEFLGHFRRLTAVQRNTFVACFLGWSLDAFDFFILVFCVSALATQFHTKVSAITEAIFLTLAMRPVGAILFGLMADRFGRRPTLMVDIIAYSVFELASAFAPSLKVFLITRALFGIAMGGEWGVGAALAFETLPVEGRGSFSGLLQEGYAVGYLMAARDWSAAGVSGDLHSHESGGVAGLEGRARIEGGGKPAGQGHPDLSGDVCVPGGADVCLQFVQSWNPGSVPDIPAEGP
jgi:MFS family permease